MKRILATILTLIMVSGIIPANAIEAKVRIMDLTHIKGVRENQLVGYGIVVGLPGTGDNSRSTQITNKMLLRNLGTVIEQENYIQKGASAAVIVTATVPPFSKIFSLNNLAFSGLNKVVDLNASNASESKTDVIPNLKLCTSGSII